MHVPSASGEPGEISSVDFAARPAIMYNLTVEIAHTFFVGEGEWLVHNTGCNLPPRDSLGRFTVDPSKPAQRRVTSASNHGNARTSPRAATLYQRVGPDGSHQKWGISQDWRTRYTSKKLGDDTIIPRKTGTRSKMMDLEKRVVRRYPGPMNRESWLK